MRARVNVANQLRHPLGPVDVALPDGRITFDHARALTRVATPRVIDELVVQLDDWIARAQDRPYRVWHHELKVWAELVDQDGPYDPNEDLARNKMSIRALGGDGITFTGELHGEFAVAFKQRVEADADQLWDRAKADHAECPELKIPPYNTLLALALEELTRDGAANPESAAAAPVDVTLVVNKSDPDVAVTPEDDIATPIERLAHLLCDAQLTMITANIVGVILNVGRAARFANRAQRRALALRDGGCVFPGCEARASWCDAHHVHHWEHHGETNLCNLASCQCDLIARGFRKVGGPSVSGRYEVGRRSLHPSSSDSTVAEMKRSSWPVVRSVFALLTAMCLVLLVGMTSANAWYSPINVDQLGYNTPGPPGGGSSACVVDSTNGYAFGGAFARLNGKNHVCGLIQVIVVYSNNGPKNGPTASGNPGDGWIQSQKTGYNIIGGNFFVFANDLGVTQFWQTSIIP